jgi:hypothetical protein
VSVRAPYGPAYRAARCWFCIKLFWLILRSTHLPPTILFEACCVDGMCNGTRVYYIRLDLHHVAFWNGRFLEDCGLSSSIHFAWVSRARIRCLYRCIVIKNLLLTNTIGCTLYIYPLLNLTSTRYSYIHYCLANYKPHLHQNYLA